MENKVESIKPSPQKDLESFLSNRGIKRLAQLLPPIDRVGSFGPDMVREEFLQWYKVFIKTAAIMTVNSGRITIQEGAVRNALEILGMTNEAIETNNVPPVGQRLLNSAPLFRLAKQIIQQLEFKEGEENKPPISLRITNGAKDKIYDASVMKILDILKSQSTTLLNKI